MSMLYNSFLTTHQLYNIYVSQAVSYGKYRAGGKIEDCMHDRQYDMTKVLLSD